MKTPPATPAKPARAGARAARGAAQRPADEPAARADPPWLQPVSEREPCGPHLEYDPEYAALLARMSPQAEVQYGDFIGRPEAPDWSELERECRRLLLRSKDLSVLVWLARCRTRLAGAAGLHEALGMLAALARRYPDALHPQCVIEGEADPAVRANALAALADPEGLLADIRDVVVVAHTALRLSVRDVERAHAVPRQPDAPPAEAVAQQLAALHAQGDAGVRALAQAAGLARGLDAWSREHLADDAPDLGALLRLLGPFAAAAEAGGDGASCEDAAGPDSTPAAATPDAPPDTAPDAPDAPAAGAASDTGAASLPPPAAGAIAEQREQIRGSLRRARQWVEQHEPSSPVAVLLKQAERLLGKRYAEVAQAIPPDLLARWDAD